VTADRAVEEATELLQQLIRNRCVNDGTPGSGQEARSAETLASYLAGPGVEMERFEPILGRTSIVLRIPGRDPAAPSLSLMGHTDVVPATTEGWTHDPFGGELIDGEIWGRGAIDMLGITATMAVATKRLLRAGWRPRGTLIYFAEADEEARGDHGAKWMVDEHWDAVRCDLLLTEFGGAHLPLGSGTVLPVGVGERGAHWTLLRARGIPGHGSMPYRTENAVATIAEATARVARYRPPAEIHGLWRDFVSALGLGSDDARTMLEPDRLEAYLDTLPLGLARAIHALTHTTFSPNVIRGGSKVNVVAEAAEVDVDVRTLPGHDMATVRAMFREALGDLWDKVEPVTMADTLATDSPQDGQLWNALARVTGRLVPGARLAPFLLMVATDARFFRPKGTVAYGYGMFSDRVPFGEFMEMFHGRNERIDQTSLKLMVDLWEGTARELLA
jgi:acetylornithine deacetylase/succinyl-diaminopimelate desuccinylase-like protein